VGWARKEVSIFEHRREPRIKTNKALNNKNPGAQIFRATSPPASCDLPPSFALVCRQLRANSPLTVHPVQIAKLIPLLAMMKKPPIRLANSVHGKERLWTKSLLCEWSHCSPAFIDEEIRARRLKVLMLSEGRARFRWEDIQSWLNAKEAIVA
jgi:hypothetical protein